MFTRELPIVRQFLSSGSAIGSLGYENLGRTALLTGDDDAEGNEEADFFAYSFDRAGGVFANRIMVSEDIKGVKAVLDAMAETKPDFVFASFKKSSAVAFLKALRSASPSAKKPVIGPESLTAFPHTLRGAR